MQFSGYSVVGTRGDMTIAPIDSAEAVVHQASRHELTEHAWLNAPDSIDALVRQAAAADREWTFGWVRRARNASPHALEQALGQHGAAVLGSAGELARAKLPGSASALRAIAARPEVTGIGAVPARWKRSALTIIDQAPSGHKPVAAFITLMTGDPAGRWGEALAQLGVLVGDFDPALRVYAAEIPGGVIDAVADADYVLAIEPVGAVRALHETAVPAMGADALRQYNDASESFEGSAGVEGDAWSVPVGVMDTGLNVQHADIASGRRSICGANFVTASPGQADGDLWRDRDGHGTHVTGTLLGNGQGEPLLAGIAPLVRDLRFAKVLTHTGEGTGEYVRRGMDFLAGATGCAETSGAPVRVKPLVVSVSLGAASLEFGGRTVVERKLDSVVWSQRQLYVVAQANEGAGGFSDMGAAKNSLAVGAAEDGGDLAFFSSHGPTADGRLAPNVVGTGVSVRSAVGDGRRTGYVDYSGTSMATPAVAGVAALLMEAAPDFREQPALTRARLMASAVKPDAFLGNAAGFPLDNTKGPGALQNRYGLGKVSARTSVLNRNQADGWTNDSAITTPFYGGYGYFDVDIPPDASRLDLVLTWDEPPADTITPAVLNDLDLWVDRGADCGGAACGEFASRSRRDNVEWVILRNPVPGAYRIKIVPQQVYTAAPRAALAGTLIRGPSTPRLRIDAGVREIDARLNEKYSVDLTLSVDGYVAAGATLRIDCRAAGVSGCPDALVVERASTASREDGLSRPLQTELADGGATVALGEVAAGEEQRVNLVFRRQPSASALRLFFTASAWNAVADATSVAVRVGDGDVEPPAALRRPANDDFRSARTIAGAEGEEAFDLLVATADPGEPPYDETAVVATGIDVPHFSVTRPTRSLWYAWRAAESGPHWFSAALPGGEGPPGGLRLDVFAGNRAAALESVAASDGALTFIAEAGTTYRVRVSAMAAPSRPGTLAWSRVVRPANDDFSHAATLSGDSGAIPGSNVGATLQPGEFLGPMAASTWYRWTAPADGAFSFAVNRSHLRVVVLVGNDLSAMRLVSGAPGRRATIPARAGEVYRIAVAARDALQSGDRYELRWSPVSGRSPGNDDFAEAITIESAETQDGTPATDHVARFDTDATVEPGEPAATGVRTRWWRWSPLQDGDYTWIVDWHTETDDHVIDPFDGPVAVPPLKVAAFRGGRFGDLELIASGPGALAARAQFRVRAHVGRRYAISLGLPSDAAFDDYGAVAATFRWGPTPANDDVRKASVLSGANGSVTGSMRFASLEPGESGDGHASLWWTWAAPETGWVRFELDGFTYGLLTIYREDATGSWERVATNEAWSRYPEATFRAEAGVRYRIRLASPDESPGEAFRLSWGETEPPVWLRYAGRVVDGDLQAGAMVDIWRPGSLASNTDGDELYTASRLGLLVFRRDAETGKLTAFETLREGDIDDDTRLLWDPHRDRLYARTRDAWLVFEPRVASAGLAEAGTLATDDALDPRIGEQFLLASQGTVLHGVDGTEGRLDTWAFSEDGEELQAVQTVPVDNLRQAVISPDNAYLYALSGESLVVFERETGTGRLDRVRTVNIGSSDAVGGDEPSEELREDLQALAIAGDGGTLFVVSGGDIGTAVFDLRTDPSSPTLTAILPPFGGVSGETGRGCRFALPRKDRQAIDVFCTSSAYSVGWRAQTLELVPTDYLGHGQDDRFDGQVPEFGTPRSVIPIAGERHLYVTAEENEILLFERVGSR